MALNEKHKTSLMIIAFFGVFVLLGILYVHHFLLGKSEIKKYESKKEKAEAEIKEMRQQLLDINALIAKRDEVDKLRTRIAQFTKLLPTSKDAPGFFETLSDGLRTTGIVREALRPERTTVNEDYTEIPYSVEAHGNYHAFGQFLTLIEQNPDRFMRVKSLEIRNNVNRPSIHPVELQLATFMFNDNLQLSVE